MDTFKYENPREVLQALPECIEAIGQHISQIKAFTGFDGYIDRIHRLVEKKTSAGLGYFKDIGTFSTHLAQLAGKSGQVELEMQKEKIGGNAPLMADALASAGLQTTCMGTLGWPDVHPVFGSLHPFVHCISVAHPAHSEAFEFDDGKLIFSECSTFQQLDWSFLKSSIGLDQIRTIVAGSSLIALVDWVNLPHATNIWRGLLNDVIVDGALPAKKFFFDLADPSRKTGDEILEVLGLISEFQNHGHVYLGLNENEAGIIYKALGGHWSRGISAESISLEIMARTELRQIVIHPVDRSLSVSRDSAISLPGRKVANPKVLTGGGDNFNAGFCLAWLFDFDPQYCLALGMAASGAYIEQGRSVDLSELRLYCQKWLKEISMTADSTGE
ncbi:MAG: hypothetical protein JJU28_14065 [Cyclobacteriaceae bacterium]|nr:hypothetical protein [Cyclobacteriaceae bacterium]